jgi:hypothetical protein
VALRDLAAPVAVLTREQWAVACQIGDQASARDLAMRFGGSLSDTVERLGTLIRAGVCAPARTSLADTDQAHTGPATSPAGAAAETMAETMAEPAPMERLPPRHRAQYLPARVVGAGQPPTMDILHQVLSGLRKLG